MVSLNLAAYINQDLSGQSALYQSMGSTGAPGKGKGVTPATFKEMLSLPIDKCPDPNALLNFTIKSTLISVSSGSETLSMMSGACGAADFMSMDSGADSEFKFQDFVNDSTQNHA